MATYNSLSLLLPLRGNLDRRTRLWETIRQTAPNIEIVVRIDDDDEESLVWLQRVTPRPIIVCGPRLRGYQSLPVFFNDMARVATGDLLMCGNDDMTFHTPGWDQLLLREANRYPDGIFNLGCMTFPAGAFPFSCVSRQTVERLGFLNDERLIFSDIFLRDVMARLNRAIFLPFIHIKHTGPINPAVHAVKGEVSTDAAAYWTLHTRCVDEAVAKLATCLLDRKNR